MSLRKKNHHFVPKFYLRNFSFQNNKKQIGLYNTRTEFFFKSAPIKSQGSKDFFYGTDGIIEDNLSNIESKMINVDTNHFVAQNDDGHYLHFRFSQDSSGQTLLHEDFHTYEEEWIFRPLKEAQFNPEDYVGKFRNSSTGATIALKRKKDGIIARKGIIKIPMIAFDKDLFFAYNHQALFMFERDDVGKMKRLIINAPDFRNFKLMRK